MSRFLIGDGHTTLRPESTAELTAGEIQELRSLTEADRPDESADAPQLD